MDAIVMANYAILALAAMSVVMIFITFFMVFSINRKVRYILEKESEEDNYAKVPEVEKEKVIEKYTEKPKLETYEPEDSTQLEGGINQK